MSLRKEIANKMKFVRIIDFHNDIINCEGSILRVVKGKEDNKIYLSAYIPKWNKRVYAKTNIETLDLYFNDKLILSELFKVRSDDFFYIGNEDLNFQQTYNFEVVAFIENIPFGDIYFTQIPVDLRISNPFHMVMSPLLDFFNCN